MDEKKQVSVRDTIMARARSADGQLSFPKLRDTTIPTVKLTDLRGEVLPTVRISARDKKRNKMSKANARLNKALGASSDYRAIRNNLSYKPILDVLGTDIPFHPEYFYVINIITEYYGVAITDVLGFIAYKEHIRSQETPEGMSMRRWRGQAISYHMSLFNERVKTCTNMIMYFLYVQYEFSPSVLLDMFGISVRALTTGIESFIREHENSVALKADFQYIHGRLMILQGGQHE